MADRSVTVRLRADIDQFQRDFAKASASSAALTRSLEGNDDSINKVGKSADSNGKQIDKLSGRLRLLGEAIAVLGPAAVPITAVAIPAVTGLTNMMALSAAGAGSLMLAFQGVGDTLKAVREAEIEPSAENLAKVEAEMSKLSPAARTFTTDLADMLPQLDEIRHAAQQGAMPGLSRALDNFEGQIPRVSRLMYELADSTGDLVAEGVDSVGSQRWADFFDFLEAEARPAMIDTVSTTGDLAHGLAELWQAFDPANDDFASGLADAADSFDRWATGLDQTEGFQEFLDYVRENGPEVVDTLGSIGNAAVQIAQAVAPLGGPVLDGLQVVFDGLASVADSPIGPNLFQAAAALALLNRTLSLTGGLLNRAGFTGTGAKVSGIAEGGVLGAIGSGSRTAATSVRQSAGQIRSGLGAITSTMMTAGARTERELQRMRSGFREMGAGARGLAKPVGAGAAAIGAMTLLSTDAGRSLGLTNTAMLGLAGSMAGPYGAAAGAAVGFTIDLASAFHDANDIVGQFDSTMTNVSSFSEASRGLQEFRDQANALAMDPSLSQRVAGGFDYIFSGFDVEDTEIGQMGASLEAAQSKVDDLKLATHLLGNQMGITGTDTASLDRALQGAQPAMASLGITTDDLIQGVRDGGIIELTDQIEQWQVRADSAAGRTRAFADSVADLANDALSTADSATQMGAALEALLGPELNAEEATDAWRASLQQLREELKSKAGFEGFSKAAMENRDMTRDYAAQSVERLKALAGLSTTTEKDMANAVAQTRREFIKSGIAAGFSRKEIARRADALGLTPKLVRTVFQAAGITQADLRARQLRAVYKGLPKRVQTDIRANGIPETGKDVDRLVEKYHLTEKQRQALITLKDLASKNIGDILNKLHIVDNTNPMPKITVQSNAAGIAAQTAAILNAISDEIVYIHTVRTGRGGQGAGYDGPAGGGTIQWPGYTRSEWGSTVPKTGRPYADRHPYLLADGEEVVTDTPALGRPATTHRPLLKAINRGADRDVIASMLAAGGTAARYMTSMHTPVGAGHREVVRIVEKLPDTIVLDAGELGDIVIDTLDGRIDDHREHDARNAATSWAGVTSD